MKLVKIIFAGTLIWTLSLIWPTVNLWLTHSAMLLGVVGLGSMITGYLLFRPHRQPHYTAELITHPIMLRSDLTETGPLSPIGVA